MPSFRSGRGTNRRLSESVVLTGVASMKALALALTAAGFLCSAARAQWPVPLCAGDQPICDALLIEEAENRISRTRELIRAALDSSDPAERQSLLRVFSSLRYFVDLYPYL